MWSVVAHRTLAGAGRAGVPFGATEGLLTSVFQPVLELLGVSLLVSDSLTQGLVIAPSHVCTELMEGWGQGETDLGAPSPQHPLPDAAQV